MKAKLLPENIRRCMTERERSQMAVPTHQEAKAKADRIAETALQNQIANLLNLHGIWFCRSRMDRKTTTPKGTPDFLFAVNGKATAVECKVGGGHLTQEQLEAAELMSHHRNGWLYLVVESLEYFQRILAKLEAGLI